VVKGPLSAPTIANGLAYVARPDAHEVVAVDTASGRVRWRFTAEGRVDSPPAIHRGLCLFGSVSGHVYALRADTGELVWRMRAAPTDERIVVCGQVESPWPVPGAVLIMDGIAYFAAGRQPFADGGILLFAVDPLTGKRRWVSRLDDIPQDGYYENSGLEFDPFDILHQEGDGFTLSRWKFSRDGRMVSVDKWNAFAKINTGQGGVYVPRGWWTYSPRHQHRFPGEPSRRPLCVFRDRALFTSLDGTTEIFRRDFNLEHGETFTPKWITGWEAATTARLGGAPYRNHRLAQKAAWKVNPYTPADEAATVKPKGAQLYNDLHALALSGDGRLFVVHKDGRLKSLSAKDGRVLAETNVPQPAWDGLAITNQRLFLSTQTGELLCLGE
jgi:outer membrane protein assembly factor BamB